VANSPASGGGYDRPAVAKTPARAFRAAKALAPQPREPGPYLIGCDALQRALMLVLRFAREQGLLPRELGIAEMWEGTPDPVQQVREENSFSFKKRTEKLFFLKKNFLTNKRVLLHS